MLIVAGAIGGLLVLIVIAIILVAFAFIIVAILKKVNLAVPQPAQNTRDQVLSTVAVSQPLPLPPCPSIDIELKTTASPQYENPSHLFSSAQSKTTVEYSIPLVGRILIPNINSQTSFV